MIKALLSPSEKGLAGVLKNNAITSSLPEEKGADILIYTKFGLFGIQRKAVPHDFISSIEDGRMTRSTSLLAQTCRFRLLICEGRFRYYPDGKLDMGPRVPTRYTYRHVWGMLFDIRYVKGVEVDYTDDIRATADYILTLAEFFGKEKHLGLYSRPSAKGTWGVPTARDVDLWLLQSFPGIGPSIAGSIVDHFGELPLGWSCTFGELCAVPKLSTKRAKEMWQVLGGEIPLPATSAFDSLRQRLQHE